MPFSQVMKEIRPTGSPIVDASRTEAPRLLINIVTVAGASPFMLESNDGVVTLESMRHRKDIRLVGLLADGQQQRRRQTRLQLSELMTLAVLFHQQALGIPA